MIKKSTKEFFLVATVFLLPFFLLIPLSEKYDMSEGLVISILFLPILTLILGAGVYKHYTSSSEEKVLLKQKYSHAGQYILRVLIALTILSFVRALLGQ